MKPLLLIIVIILLLAITYNAIGIRNAIKKMESEMHEEYMNNFKNQVNQ